MLQPSNKFDLKTQEDILVKQTVPVYNESTLLQLSSTQKMDMTGRLAKIHDQVVPDLFPKRT